MGSSSLPPPLSLEAQALLASDAAERSRVLAQSADPIGFVERVAKLALSALRWPEQDAPVDGVSVLAWALANGATLTAEYTGPSVVPIGTVRPLQVVASRPACMELLALEAPGSPSFSDWLQSAPPLASSLLDELSYEALHVPGLRAFEAVQTVRTTRGLGPPAPRVRPSSRPEIWAFSVVQEACRRGVEGVPLLRAAHAGGVDWSARDDLGYCVLTMALSHLGTAARAFLAPERERALAAVVPLATELVRMGADPHALNPGRSTPCQELGRRFPEQAPAVEAAWAAWRAETMEQALPPPSSPHARFRL